MKEAQQLQKELPVKQENFTINSSLQVMVRDIRRQTRRKFPAEEKICIVLEGLRGEVSIAELFLNNRVL